MKTTVLMLWFLAFWTSIAAQVVDVRSEYTALGDCVFSATNRAATPMFLHLKFADLENTSFSEPVPYVKKLNPGFNALFTLLLDSGAEDLRFNYDIKIYPSNPLPEIDLYFPYLIPLEKGKSISVFDVPDIAGFWGTDSPDSWVATGFYANAGDAVVAARNGEVVEIVGDERVGESLVWYHAWNYSVTLLHDDGSLMCYHNVISTPELLQVGDRIFAGQKLGQLANGCNGLVVLIFHHSLFSDQPLFVLPEFVTSADGSSEILNTSQSYTVFHPRAVKGLEMTKKEKKKILGSRR